MAEKKIGAKIVIDGESEFRANLNSAKTALNNFDSELKLVSASYKNNANSLEALRAKQQVYIKLQEEQRNKVSLLAEMQEKAIRKLEDEQSTLTSLGQKREQLKNALEEAINISLSSSNLYSSGFERQNSSGITILLGNIFSGVKYVIILRSLCKFLEVDFLA